MSIAQNFPNIKPSLMLSFADTKQLDNRVTFTRSTPAVYYDGKTTAMAEQNLLLYSQDFSNFWGLTGNTITPDNTTAPDGTTTADKTERTTTGLNAIVVSSGLPSSLGVPKTVSIYAKAGTKSVIQWDANTANWNNDFYVNFDLSAGTISANSAGVPASITSVGNGWYRCSITSSGVGTQVIWVVCDSPTSLRESTSTAGYLYIWGAQYEQRASATAYTATTTQPITNYIPVLLSAGGNQARFDCNPTTGESLGLLIEEQRTNLATYSEDFSYYTGSGSITVNQGIAPNGTQTADLITGTSDIYQTLVGSSSGTYSLSMYVRSITAPYFMLSFGYPSVQRVVFNLSNGSVSSTVGTNITGSSISVGNNWYRLTIVGISQGSILYNQFNSYASTTYNDKTTGALIWGAQLEAANTASSYIATTSASATRTADAAVMTGTNFSSWWSAGEGTFYSECANVNVRPSGAANTIWSVVDIATNSTTEYGARFGAATNNCYLYANGGYAASLDFASSSSARIAFGFENGNSQVAANNASVATNTNLFAPSNLMTRLIIGNDWPAGYELNGCIKKIAFYPQRFTSNVTVGLSS